jgi:hypothetical protein
MRQSRRCRRGTGATSVSNATGWIVMSKPSRTKAQHGHAFRAERQLQTPFAKRRRTQSCQSDFSMERPIQQQSPSAPPRPYGPNFRPPCAGGGRTALNVDVRACSTASGGCSAAMGYGRVAGRHASVSPSGRHPTGSATRQSISGSRQPAPWMEMRNWAGKLPSADLRQRAERDRPDRARTVRRRLMRSGSGMVLLAPAGFECGVLSQPAGRDGRARLPGSS